MGCLRVVNYFGPTDFLQMDAQRLPDGMTHNDADSPESELVGGAIQAHPDAVAAANPITYVTPESFVIGFDGEVTRLEKLCK